MTWKEKEREKAERRKGRGKEGERDKGNCEQRERKEEGVRGGMGARGPHRDPAILPVGTPMSENFAG